MVVIRNELYFLSICLISHAFANASNDKFAEEKGYPNYKCKNGDVIKGADRCDGIYNCRDQSDEHDCENEGLLMYSSTKTLKSANKLEKRCLLKAAHFQNISDAFTIVSHNACTEFSILAAFGPNVYFRNQSASNSSHLSRINRNGSNEMTFHRFDQDLQRHNHMEIEIDWITGNIYILNNGRIQVCNNDFSVCTFLENRFMKKPTSLALSVISKKLFWIEEETSEHSYIGTSFSDASSPWVLQSELASTKHLTADDRSQRLYWLDWDDWLNSKTFYGDDFQFVYISRIESSSFTVFKDNVYWLTANNKEIVTCDMANCSTSISSVVKSATDETINEILAYDLLAEETNDPCKDAMCSDLCLPSKGNTFSCACDHGGVLGVNEWYCDGTTMIATYGNDLYVIGQVFSTFPVIRKQSLDLTSVSALAYDSINGHVILAEDGHQNIYMVDPLKIHDNMKIYEGGSGSIECLEFDEYGNNIYWLDTIKREISVINLPVFHITTVLKGNESYVPTDFTLAPNHGVMYVAFLSEWTITIERISMDGRNNTRTIIHSEEAKHKNGNLTLQYVPGEDILIWMKSGTGCISFLHTPQSNGRESGVIADCSGKRSTLSNSLTSLDGKLIWSDDTPEIFWRNTDRNCSNNQIHLGSNIEKAQHKTLKIAGVRTDKKETPCRVENGKCEQLCLVTDGPKHVCACQSDFVLINSTHCKKYEANDLTETPSNDTTLEDSTAEEEFITSPSHETYNPCKDATCSDSCQHINEDNFNCTCDQGGVLGINERYCDGATILATYGNDFFIIGRAFAKSPLTRKYSLKLDSISALTYDTINGHVILADQNIHTFHPENLLVKKIHEGGSGPIECLEFDEYGNNIYWIDPKEHEIKVFSQNTFHSTTVLRGNESYVLNDFTLAPQRRVMYVAFLSKRIINIERISMDGGNKTRIIVHREEAKNENGKLTLHYVRDKDMLVWMESGTKKIKYFHIPKRQESSKEIKTHAVGEKITSFSSLTSLDGKIIWTENSAAIWWDDFEDDASRVPIKIDGIQKSWQKTLKIASVQTKEEVTPCHAENGECEQICLASDDEEQCVCAYELSYGLFNSTHCKKNLHVTKDTEQQKEKDSSNAVSKCSEDNPQCSKPNRKPAFFLLIIMMIGFSAIGITVAVVLRCRDQNFRERMRLVKFRARMTSTQGTDNLQVVTLESCSMREPLLSC